MINATAVSSGSVYRNLKVWFEKETSPKDLPKEQLEEYQEKTVEAKGRTKFKKSIVNYGKAH